MIARWDRNTPREFGAMVTFRFRIVTLAALTLTCNLGCGSRTGNPTGGATCEDSATALAKSIQPLADVSTIVVRVGYGTHEILGWHYFSDPSSMNVAEGDALFVAETDTGFGNLPRARGLSGVGSVDEFVFLWSGGDIGGVAAVSVRTGKTVFGGSTAFMGGGTINYPKTWSPPEQLGSVCTTVGPLPSWRGVSQVEETLDSKELSAVFMAAWNTPIPGALAGSDQMPLDAVMLYYLGSSGGFNPRAEWIVIVNLARVIRRD